MINQRDRKIIEAEVNKMVERSAIDTILFYWDSMSSLFFTPPNSVARVEIHIEGDTTDEMIEAIRTDVNQILQEMCDVLEASKLDYKYGKGGLTV